MKPCEHAALVTAIACSVFNAFPAEDIALIAADLVQLGDTLASMLVRAEQIESRCSLKNSSGNA